MTVTYDPRQQRVIDKLVSRGLILRTNPAMDAHFRVTGDQVCFNLNVVERLLKLPPIEESREDEEDDDSIGDDTIGMIPPKY